MFWMSAVLAVVHLCGMAFMPYSPKWLFSQGRRAEAKAVLVKIVTDQVSWGVTTCPMTCKYTTRQTGYDAITASSTQSVSNAFVVDDVLKTGSVRPNSGSMRALELNIATHPSSGTI